MPLYKSSQLMNADDDFESFGDEDEVVLYDEKPSKDDVIEMHDPDHHSDETIEISFKLPPLPGSDADIPIEVSTDDEVEVESKGKDKDKNDLKPGNLEVADPWDYRAAADPLVWVRDRLASIPRHSGRETAGIERAIAYLKRLNGEMSKAASNDFDGKIDITKFEEARREIYSAIERLEEAKNKLETSQYKKKKAEVNPEMVKEGQKATHVGGIIVTVPIFISRLARICINGQVSAGHDIEDLYGRLVKKHALDNQQQAELMQLLCDMGYPLRRDRGFDVNELIDETSSDNFDWAANYPA